MPTHKDYPGILTPSRFSSIVINGFGYSPFRTMLLGTPGGAFSFVTVWISALIPRFLPNTRVYTCIFLAILPLVGSVVMLTVPVEQAQHGNTWAIVAATWLASCTSAPLCGVAALIASNVKGNTKKSVVSAGFFISYCVGCIGKLRQGVNSLLVQPHTNPS